MNAKHRRINSSIWTANPGRLAMRKVFTMKLTLCIVAGSAIALSGNPAAAQLLDSFDNGINPLLWVAYGSGGPQATATNQSVQMVVPWDSAGGVFGATVQSLCKLRGDYDIQVDFELLDFPFQNGIRVALGADGQMERISLGDPLLDFAGSPRENYVMDIYGSLAFIPTSDLAGKLRQVRTGSTVTGYYWDITMSQWIEVGSASATGADVVFGVSVWSHDYAFTDQEVRVTFDNMLVNYGTLVCDQPINELAVLDALIDYELAVGGVSPQVEQSFDAKVKAAMEAVARGNPNDAVVAMNILEALVRYVYAQADNQITAEAAAAIIERIESIIASLDG